MAFPDYAYDLYEDFEDATRTGWTTVNPDTNVDEESTVQKFYGSQSMEIDTDGATAGKDVAYAYYDRGSAQSVDISVGFWFYHDSYTDAFIAPDHIINLGAGIGDSFNTTCRILYDRSGGDPIINLAGATSSGTISLSLATWYWITVKAVVNSTCTLRVYDTSENLVGSEQTCTGKNNNWRYLNFGLLGVLDMSDTNVNFYWDEIVVDWTAADYPLLGWESAGGIVLHSSNYSRQRRI